LAEEQDWLDGEVSPAHNGDALKRPLTQSNAQTAWPSSPAHRSCTASAPDAGIPWRRWRPGIELVRMYKEESDLGQTLGIRIIQSSCGLRRVLILNQRLLRVLQLRFGAAPPTQYRGRPIAKGEARFAAAAPS
jgi:hypothetical protein